MTYYAYVSFHLANNVFNNTGIECFWFDLLTLKFLPFRSQNSHHDAHHRFTNFGTNAKNFAEMFWIWDYLFQTLNEGAANLAKKQQLRKQFSPKKSDE
jgi:sterol desaturase/sphingolipid hydroxylase (fatty acid hydroxylase superfamily)